MHRAVGPPQRRTPNRWADSGNSRRDPAGRSWPGTIPIDIPAGPPGRRTEAGSRSRLRNKGGGWHRHPDLSRKPRLADRREKIPFHLSKRFAHDRLAGNQDCRHRARQLSPMEAKRLPKQALGPISNDGSTDRTAGDETDTVVVKSSGLCGQPIQDQTTLNGSPAGGLESRKIPSGAQSVTPTQTQTHPVSGCCGHGERRAVWLRPASNGGVPGDGDWRGWPSPLWWPCGRGTHAGGRGESSKAGTDVSW